MKSAATLVLLAGLALTVGACSGDGSEATTTASPTTTLASVTSLAAIDSTTTTAAPAPSTSSTTVEPGGEPTFPDYTIVSREQGDAGDTVVILLDPETYTKLSDIDLANVLADVVERFPPIVTAYVIDNPDAAAAVVAVEPTEEQQAILELHYLVRLEDGFRMVFAGPFSDIPIAILGS